MPLRASHLPMHRAGEPLGDLGLGILAAGSQDKQALAPKGTEMVQQLLKMPSKIQGHAGTGWAWV